MNVSDNDIMEAALNLFAEKGYTSVSTREIATAAGITEMTLFRKFESKKKLFLRSVFHACTDEVYAQSLDLVPCEDSEEAFRQFARLMSRSFEAHRRITRIIAHCPEVKDPEFERMAHEQMISAKQDIERFLSRIVAANPGCAANENPNGVDVSRLSLEILSQALGVFFLMEMMQIEEKSTWDSVLETSMMRISEAFRKRL